MGRPYDGKLGIITGGSRGIGAATAAKLASKGCNLLLAYASASSQERTQRLCAELSSEHGVECASVRADLAEGPDAVSRIMEAAQRLFDACARDRETGLRVDMLINSAGVASNQRLNDSRRGPVDAAEFHRVYAVNVLGALLLTQAVAPHLPRDRSGRIVNVSSVSSSIGYAGQSVYAGSKGALEAMTRVWSRELAEQATVNAVNPGPVWGDMYVEAGPGLWAANQPFVDAAPLMAYDGEAAVLEMLGGEGERERFDALVRGEMGGRRMAFASEIAGSIDMLCSAEGGWTTGSVVCANGGMRWTVA